MLQNPSPPVAQVFLNSIGQQLLNGDALGIGKILGLLERAFGIEID